MNEGGSEKMIIIPQHDESLMPIKLGPMTRVPEYALRKYGIKWDSDYELRRVIDISEADYMAEWDSGTEEQMKLVSKASESCLLYTSPSPRD